MVGGGEESVALSVSQWQDFNASVLRRVEEAGEWVGLFDGNYQPLCELPPLVSMSAPKDPGQLSEATFQFPALTPSGEAHQAVDALFGPGFAGDEITPLAAPVRKHFFIVVQRPGGRASRRTYKVVFPTMSFVENLPAVVTVETVSANIMLDFWPAPSVPVTWGNVAIREWGQDAGGTYPDGEVYRYAPIEMAQTALGYTLTGPVRTAATQLIAESLHAGYRLHPEWGGRTNAHLVVQNASGGEHMLIQRQDVSIWETISEPVTLAGVVVDTSLWWPGDEPVQVRFGSTVWTFSGRPVLITELR